MSTQLATAPLSIEDATRLGRCEGIIKKGLETFVEVGEALMIIRDNRLYREEFQTFEDYCNERWGMARRTAYQLVDAATTIKNLNVRHGAQSPSSERQARPLTSLQPETQRLAWEETVNRYGDSITAKKVADVVGEYAPVDEMIREAKQPMSDIFSTTPAEHVNAIRHEGKDAEGFGRKYAEEIKKAHVGHNSGNNEWYTPVKFIDSAKVVMGDIDLDPATSELANETVGASNIYTSETNGLESPWFGRVWMNPPYAQPLISNFSDKVAASYASGEVEQAIVLVNNATETGWFQAMAKEASAICFPKKRVRFYNPEGELGAPLQGQAILYMGGNPEGFHAEFSKHGKTLLSHE
jgi:phage N-6-adenine-methyltransferase